MRPAGARVAGTPTARTAHTTVAPGDTTAALGRASRGRAVKDDQRGHAPSEVA